MWPALASSFGKLRQVQGSAWVALCTALLSTWSRHMAAVEPAPGEPCPTREETLRAVYALLGQASISLEELAQIAVTDQGATYSISVKGRLREYSDSARDCAQRARTSAVFVALTLAPPDIADVASEPLEPEPPSTGLDVHAPPPHTASTSSPSDAQPRPDASIQSSNAHRHLVRLELGARIALPIDVNLGSVNWGAESRFIVSQEDYGVSAAFDAYAPARTEYRSMDIQQSRYTADVALRRNWTSTGLRMAFDLGVLLGLERFKLLGAPDAQQVARWQPGVRFGAVAGTPGHLLSPFIGADIEVLPLRVPIAVRPDGIIGHSSVIWVGTTLGLVLGAN